MPPSSDANASPARPIGSPLRHDVSAVGIVAVAVHLQRRDARHVAVLALDEVPAGLPLVAAEQARVEHELRERRVGRIRVPGGPHLGREVVEVRRARVDGLGAARRAREGDVAAADEHGGAGLRPLHHGGRGAVVGSEHRERGRRRQHLHDARGARRARSAAVVEHLAGRRVDHLRLQVRETGIGRAIGDRAGADAARGGRGGRSRPGRLRGGGRGRCRRDGLDRLAAGDGGPGEQGTRSEQGHGEHAAGDREREAVLPGERGDGCPEARCPGRRGRGGGIRGVLSGRRGVRRAGDGVVGAASAAPLAGSRAGSPGVVGSPAASVSSVTRRIVRGGPERNLIVARMPAGGRDDRSRGHSPG